MDFTDGTLNLKKDNTAHKILADMLEAAGVADLVGMQENYTAATASAIRQFRARLPRWNIWVPDGAVDNPIAYNTEVFREIKELRRWKRVHKGQAGITPSREITLLALEHKASEKTVARINVHAINAFDKTGFQMPALRDRYAEAYFRDLAEMIVWAQERFDIVLVGGDFNVTFDQHDRGWYPGVLLKPLCVFDAAKGIDHLMPARGSGVVSVRRWFRHVNSDHNLHLHTYRITEEAEMKFVSRAAWGATRKRPTAATHPIGATKGITAHWEGPGMGHFSHSLCARKVRAIERFHEVNRGWSGIAYNAIVCPHGYVFEGRGPGVKSAANGNEQVNGDWYAVCYLGGVGDNFTEAGKKGFLDAFAWLTKRGNAGPGRNGHRDHKQTTCPGDEIYRWVHNLKAGAVGSTEEEDDMAWDHEFPAWGPDDNPAGEMPMDQQLQQARGYAEDAYRRSKAVDARTKRIEEAVKALGKGLDKIAPGVEQAVRDALAEAVVDVDVNVRQPAKE